jgi:hypothetical protein
MVLLLMQELRMVKRDWVFLCILLLGGILLKMEINSIDYAEILSIGLAQ